MLRLTIALTTALICAIVLHSSLERVHASEPNTVDADSGASREASRTDAEAVSREAEAIQLDGLNAAQMRELREKAEKHKFQAEVDRMMKLIINSLYKNKEIFIRELISNASDALDKIRLLSLTDKAQMDTNGELVIRIKSNPTGRTLHLIDTGIGMTRDELVNNLGTLAKSGTSEFLERMTSAKSENEATDLIGQFGVGFYSSFLVSDRVTVVSKHNNESQQHIWESDAENAFTITTDPRGDTLKRGTEIILHMKEEAAEYLEDSKLKEIVKKYSQFINFPIYLWSKKTEMVDEPVEPEKKEEGKEEDEAKVEEDSEKKTKKVEKTVWDWELVNDQKPIWLRKTSDVTEEEYESFYKALTHESDKPLAHIHFTAEGEVSFKSILFVPPRAANDMFQQYGKKTENIKLYVRRVFITDDFQEMVPKYLSFIKGLIDSDDLPLNVSRETLQQHKLLQVIKKKIVRKVLDMLKKMQKDEFVKFYKEFSTNLKLGVIEDHANRARIAKLLRFASSHTVQDATEKEPKQTTLEEYVGRMKDKQENIYFVGGRTLGEVMHSPFVERLRKRGYEVLYLTEPIDEYCIQNLPEFEGKKFMNAAKEGLKLAGDDSTSAKERREALEKEHKPLLDWLKDNALADKIEKAVISERLVNTPCALVASQYGWSGNMERLMKAQAYAKAHDTQAEYYFSQKKIFEVNPRHPLVKELKRRFDDNAEDVEAKDLAMLLFETASLRSGYDMRDTVKFAERIESMLRRSYNISPDEKVEEEPEPEPEPEPETTEKKPEEKKSDDDDEAKHDHSEL